MMTKSDAIKYYTKVIAEGAESLEGATDECLAILNESMEAAQCALDALKRDWISTAVNDKPKAKDSGPSDYIVRVFDDGHLELVYWWSVVKNSKFWYPLPDLPQ